MKIHDLNEAAELKREYEDVERLINAAKYRTFLEIHNRPIQMGEKTREALINTLRVRREEIEEELKTFGVTLS